MVRHSFTIIFSSYLYFCVDMCRIMLHVSKGPGGFNRLRVVPLDGRLTVGYNVTGFKSPFVSPGSESDIPSHCVILCNQVVFLFHNFLLFWHRQRPYLTKRIYDLFATNTMIKAFSVNYADITIRWGLYESALRFVGWPITPGFDVSGVVEQAGADSKFKVLCIFLK
jgi:hypothetical protein